MLPVTIVDTVEGLREMIVHLKESRVFAWDHETRSIDYVKWPRGALRKMTCLSDLVSFATSTRAFVCVLNMQMKQGIKEKVFFSKIKPIMEDGRYIKLAWNACFDMHCMANYGVWVTNFRDVMILGYLLDTTRGNSLKERCSDIGMTLHKFPFKDYWKCRAMITGEIERKARMKQYTHDDLKRLEEEYIKYSAEDSIATIKLWEEYEPKVRDIPKLWNIFIKLRNPAVRTLFNMERRGIPIDKPGMLRECKKIEIERDEAEAAVYRIAGKHFNIASTKELPHVLYQEMSLPVYKTTPGGKPSTDEDTMDRLAQEGHEIAQAVVKWRQKNKLVTTYFGENSKVVGEAYSWFNSEGEEQHNIHCNWNITGTRTGRLSSSNPNGQNFLKNNEGSHFFRNFFIASPGYRLVGGDFSQIELRIMAHMSMDPVMCAEYRKDAELKLALDGGMQYAEAKKLYGASDIHQTTADACNCTRDEAKVVNFGILYGMQSKSLGFTLTKANWDRCIEEGGNWDPLRDIIDEGHASIIHNAVFSKYAGIKAYQQAVARRVKQQGYIETRYGQRRHLPDIWSEDWFLKSAAERQAVNTTIQGHVGELMLLLMNKVERDPVCRKLGFRLFMQVHDEVLGEAPSGNEEAARVRLTQIFQNPAESTESFPFSGYRIPLVFEAKVGDTWGRIH